MGAPKLKMNKNDVEMAIARTFKKKIPSLTFNKDQVFSAFDPEGQCVFTLQESFHGKGKYRINGQAKLWDDSHTVSMNYRIETYVSVEDDDDESPIILFNDILSANRI